MDNPSSWEKVFSNYTGCIGWREDFTEPLKK